MQSSALATMPGITIGRATRKKAPKSVQPSVSAASSISFGSGAEVGEHHPDDEGAC